MRSLPFGLAGPDAFRVSEVRDEPLPAHKRHQGPSLRRWMQEQYGDKAFSATARALREINQRRHDAAQSNRPTRVA